MASTIKVNNIQNQCGANIANKCGSTITLGASGDTITLACGASQTGFGRTGTVDWDTTAKTASFTAVSGNGYFVNTTSGAITLTLPASPSAGDIVAVSDYANTFATNNLTVARNGSLINGVAFDYTISTNGISLTFVYVDGTRGWKNVNDGTTNATGDNPFIVATGGTVTTCGDCKIHTFTGPGTFTVCNVASICAPTRNQVSYMVIAGGGAGAELYGGGGGAGGFREYKTPLTPYTASPLNGNPGGTSVTVTATAFPITVGAGGSGGALGPGNPGSNSVFSTITSAGGAGGGINNSTPAPSGGSGGGGGGDGSAGTGGGGGAGNTPPVNPPQGNPGGNGGARDAYGPGGGGGGAGGTGSTATPTSAGPGGNGIATSISGSSVTRAGGGGGAIVFQPDSNGGNAGPGGGGIGGGGGASNTTATAGTANTGGGGGGGGANVPDEDGRSGGSGIVIIRYKYQ